MRQDKISETRYQVNRDKMNPELCELFKSELDLTIPIDYQTNKEAGLLCEHALNYLQEIYGQCQIHDTSVPYVAMNIFDRINSKHPSLIHKEIDLFVISCLTISCKKKIESFRARTFLLEKQINYSLGEVILLERRILKTLEWIIDPNPFCFLKYFLPLLPPGQIIRRPHVFQIFCLVSSRFTQFRPSTLAAAAILCVFPEHGFTKCIAQSKYFLPLDMKKVTDCMTMMENKYREKLNSWKAKSLRTTKPSTSAILPSIVNEGCKEKPMIDNDDHSTIECEETEMEFELEWIKERTSRVDTSSMSEIFCKTWSWVATHFLEALDYFRPEREDGHALRVEDAPTTSQHHHAPRFRRADNCVLSKEDSLRTRQHHQTPMRMLRQHWLIHFSY